VGIHRKSTSPELRNRQHRRFEERAGHDLDSVPDAIAVDERDLAGAAGGHANIVPPEAKKRRIKLCPIRF